MKLLVTGGAGYIGSVLIPILLDEGYDVKCLDRFFFGDESLKPVLGNPRLKVIKDDIRWFNPNILRGVDAVIDLAALSNDPSGELDPAKTHEINHLGRVRVAKFSKKYGVERYILPSSCSVYGFRQNVVLGEDSTTNPLTTYAKANLSVEQDLLPLADESFSVTVARLATVYGLSPRMRFDLAINGMVVSLARTGKVPVMRDGTQWRPFVHVRDIARVFLRIIDSPRDMVNGEIFNVGANDQNYKIGDLARIVGEALKMGFDIEWYGSPDARSYRVEFGKIERTLGFKPEMTPKEGAQEIYRALKEGVVTDSVRTKTVEWYKHLLQVHALVKEVELRGKIL